ncbi:MAG: biotin/lipoyl-containing protein [Desulfitobacteriaceae bacterium]
MADIVSPLDGKVVNINVSVGDVVEEDDEVIIVEALKMETPIYAPQAGKVASIDVKEGDNVKENQVMLVIE